MSQGLLGLFTPAFVKQSASKISKIILSKVEACAAQYLCSL